MKQFKLGFGPMSKEIINILCDWAIEEEYPIMIIASRNQVDFDSGYVCKTNELSDIIKSHNTDKILLCRDHCGPYFTDLDKGLSVDEAMIRCKETIKADISAGFDLIHVDVSRIPDNQLEYAKELLDYALSLNPSIKLEFGSEDNTGIDINSSIARLDPQLEFLQQYKNNIVFFVTQTGSLTKENQLGNFDVARNKEILEKVHAAGFLFKEHNADYFTEEDIQLRIEAGIDSLNIAPQLGKIQTETLKKLSPEDVWNKFSDYVYSKNYWQRWVQSDTADKESATLVSGHYCYNSDEYKNIIEKIDYENFYDILKYRVNKLLDFYQTFDSENEEVQYKIRLAKRLEELRKRDPFIYR